MKSSSDDDSSDDISDDAACRGRSHRRFESKGERTFACE
jgi:hypothetical protein